MKKTFRQYVLICIGIISVALGTAGIFLPLLPTTPFLLLAAACFLRSSKRLHAWVMNHKWFGPYIYNYCTYKAIPKKTKIISITLLWLTITYSALWVVPVVAVKFLLFFIAIAVTWHLLSLKTLEKVQSKPKAVAPPFPEKTGQEAAKLATENLVCQSVDREQSGITEKDTYYK